MTTPRLERAKQNRDKWKRFSRCSYCKNKLMAYLEDGHTFDECVSALKERHSEIKNIREYTRHAIRATTGDGVFDDYIMEHNLWKLRCPVLTKDEKDGLGWRYREQLEEMWKNRAEKGRHLIETDKAVEPLLKKINNPDSEEGRLLRYLLVHGLPKSKNVGAL